MLSQKVPMGVGWLWKDVLKYLRYRRFLLPLVFLIWFFDKIGWFLEHTPLCFLFSGFWINRYIPKGRKIIQEYRQGQHTQEECERLLKRIDFKLYGCWLLFSSPVQIGILAFLVPLISETFGSFAILSLTLLTFFIHEFACSSAVRRWRAAKESGDEELAEMINIASPNCLRYFRKFVLI